MKTSNFLDELRVRYDLPSDYAVAAMLGSHRQVISRYRNGRTFDDAMAMRVADLLRAKGADYSDAFVLACMQEERAEMAGHQDAGRAWRTAAALLRHGGKAAGLFLFAVLVALQHQTAGEPLGAIQAVRNAMMYIMSTLRAAAAVLGRFRGFCESSVSHFRPSLV